MQKARLIEMGQLTTVDLDGQKVEYPRALLLTFDDVDAIRAAIRDGKVQFVFGDDPMPNAGLSGEPRSGESRLKP